MSNRASTRLLVSGTTALAVSLALSGCAGPRGEAPEARIVAEVDCFQHDAADAVMPGRVPAGFEPVAAYRCDDTTTIETAEGQWSGGIVERLEGDLTPLLGALREPDDAHWPGPCSAVGAIVPELWLIDAHGDAIHVGYPVTGCGLPKTTAVFAALAGLRVVERQEKPREMLESTAARDAGCPTRWQPMRLATPDRIDVPSGAVATSGDVVTIPAPPAMMPSAAELAGMRLCRYSSAPDAAPSPSGARHPDDDPAAGADAQAEQTAVSWFTSAHELDATDARRIAAALEPATESAAPCTATAARAALAFGIPRSGSIGQPVAIELDGCREVITLVGPPTRASEELVHLIESVG